MANCARNEASTRWKKQHGDWKRWRRRHVQKETSSEVDTTNEEGARRLVEQGAWISSIMYQEKVQ